LRKTPPSPARLIVVATTAISHYLEDLQLTQAFNVTLHVSLLQNASEIQSVLLQYTNLNSTEISSISSSITKPIGVKQLLMVLEMARSEDNDSINTNDFLECLQTIGF
jgi:vesicle-fusing ATPase